MRKLFTFLALILLSLTFFSSPVLAAECREGWAGSDSLVDLARYEKECLEVISLFSEANFKNKETLKDFETQVGRYEVIIKAAEKQVKRLENDIVDREVDLGAQKVLLGERIRRFYIHQRGYSVLTVFLAAKNSSQFLRSFHYQQLVASEDKKAIEDLSRQLAQLVKDQEELEKNQNWLAGKKKEAEKQVSFFQKEVEKAEDYIGDLSAVVASLSAKQKSLLSARSGTFTSSVGDVPISFIPCSGPPGSPTYCDPGGGDWFAAFSFGAWTHRKGMSQYGAKGRADAGQSFEQILQAYYSFEGYEDRGGITIRVNDGDAVNQGNVVWSGSLEEYVKRIYEVPSSWPAVVLQAQSIAARSYVLAVTGNGAGTICANEHCQVFKTDPKGGEWESAVNSTSGKVMVSGGQAVKAYYSSTAGGYLTTSGWDTTDGQGGEGFASRAWESKAGTPWFYSSWFTQTYNSNSAKCNRSHPWLNSEEMADILNAWLVLSKQGNDERIMPVTINQCPIGGITGNPYSMDELRNKANEHGGAFTSVSSVSVTYSNDGFTSSLNFNTNKGSIPNVPGSEFKQAFNLRAPGHIAIRSPLFNIEKK